VYPDANGSIDRLLSNPWAQPPLPSDWEVQPTYPRRTVPYYLAPLWDAAEFQRSVEEKMRGKAKNRNSRHGRGHVSPAEEAASNVPKEVRAKLKHARAAKGLLQDLEEEVRLFLQKWSEKGERRREDGLHDVDSGEEEIVFVGRNGVMHDSPGRKEKYHHDVGREKMLFEGMADDKGASFG
jgi:R3H-associated N-terminal domain